MTFTYDDETTTVLVSDSDDYKFLDTFGELPESVIEVAFDVGREQELPEGRISVMPHPKLWVSAERVPTTVSITAGPVLTLQLETTERHEMVMALVESIEEDFEGIVSAEMTTFDGSKADEELAEKIAAFVKEVAKE
jgi:hypothetical protein